MSFIASLLRKKSVSDAIANAEHESAAGNGLDKNLTVLDLTALGIAAIIGAGIFSTIGSASFNGGPGVVFLFIFTAIACGFAAFAYAEFASMVPVSGSAYTYSYVAFGELVAWIIGWALIMEYSVGNITVAVSWSGYFTSLCASAGWHIPAWATIDYPSARDGFESVAALLKSGTQLDSLTLSQQECYNAWQYAPQIGGFRTILDLPAIIMSILITALVYVGMKESKTAGNTMVALKMLIVFAVIGVGAFYVDTANWHPFVPNGFGGIMSGVSSVFFAYIGFDALSTTAEECRNPQRDLPRAMVYSIIICTILYIIIALVLTGMVSYKELDVDDPLAFVFERINLKWFSGVIAISAVFAMAGVFLVFQLGQPRIWMTMSRDGLLPKRFAHIHPRFRTPDFSTIITGVFVIVPMLFIPSDTVLDLCSMGTLFAFVLVCAGVLKLQVTPDAPHGKFRTPYANAKWIFPAMLLAGAFFIFSKYNDEAVDWLNNVKSPHAIEDIMAKMSEQDIASLKITVANMDKNFDMGKGNLVEYYNALGERDQTAFVERLPVPENVKFESGWANFQHKIPMWLFLLTCLTLVWLCFQHNLSLIPVLGLVTCLYMMAQIPSKSWLAFFLWLVAGLVIYFGHGYKHSKLRARE